MLKPFSLSTFTLKTPSKYKCLYTVCGGIQKNLVSWKACFLNGSHLYIFLKTFFIMVNKLTKNIVESGGWIRGGFSIELIYCN